jgi:hypothetical protein
MVKRSRTSCFRYFDEKKNTGNFAFTAPVENLQWTVAMFLAEAQENGRENARENASENGRPQQLYLQETLSGHPELSKEFASWNWALLLQISKAFNWGLPESNELFIGMEGNETPLHYDERENLLFQVRGQKEVCVFPWTDYNRLYPFPCCHPCDRQSMVGTPLHPDLASFPKFADATGYTALLKPGDLLYIPYGWWHWLRNAASLAVSISFWSLTPRNDAITSSDWKHLPDSVMVQVLRNMENLIAHENPARLNENMLKIRESIIAKEAGNLTLARLRKILGECFGMPEEQQDEFLLGMIEGRFGIDWQAHVDGGGLGTSTLIMSA